MPFEPMPSPSTAPSRERLTRPETANESPETRRNRSVLPKVSRGPGEREFTVMGKVKRISDEEFKAVSLLYKKAMHKKRVGYKEFESKGVLEPSKKLKKLRRDPDWAAVIDMPRYSGDGYALKLS